MEDAKAESEEGTMDYQRSQEMCKIISEYYTIDRTK